MKETDAQSLRDRSLSEEVSKVGNSATGEIVKLLTAAEQMAEGLVELTDHIYELTGGTVKQPLAAANQLSTWTTEWLHEFQNRSYDETDGHA